MTEHTANLDARELEKFNRKENDWWNDQGPFKTLHSINPARIEFINRQLDLNGKLVLDIGCGGGILSEALAKQAKHVTAIDLSDSAIATAYNHAVEQQIHNIEYKHIATEEFAPSNKNKFDVITCMELLEHVPQPASIIQACAEMLKPNGVTFLSTLNRNPVSYIKAVIAAEHILKLLPKGTHDYAKFIKPSELTALCRAHGLDVDEISGLHYLPLLNKSYLNNQVDTNYILCARKKVN